MHSSINFAFITTHFIALCSNFLLERSRVKWFVHLDGGFREQKGDVMWCRFEEVGFEIRMLDYGFGLAYVYIIPRGPGI